MSPNANSATTDKDRLDYLKEMERFCTGINNNIYDLNIISQMSGNLLITQYDHYMRDIINKRREPIYGEWKYIQYEKVINKLKKRRNLK